MLKASAEVPNEKSVLLNASTPTTTIKIIRIMMKITPKDPILRNICMSFLLQRMTNTTKRNSAQYEEEKWENVGSAYKIGFVPEIQA